MSSGVAHAVADSLGFGYLDPELNRWSNQALTVRMIASHNSQLLLLQNKLRAYGRFIR